MNVLAAETATLAKQSLLDAVDSLGGEDNFLGTQGQDSASLGSLVNSIEIASAPANLGTTASASSARASSVPAKSPVGAETQSSG